MSKALHFGNVIHIVHIATSYNEYHWNRHGFNSPLIADTKGGFNFLNEPKESFRMRATIETHCCLSPCLTCILREVLYYPIKSAENSSESISNRFHTFEQAKRSFLVSTWSHGQRWDVNETPSQVGKGKTSYWKWQLMASNNGACDNERAIDIGGDSLCMAIT
jgi:hypothetical protein